jgi:hypothetical protein
MCPFPLKRAIGVDIRELGEVTLILYREEKKYSFVTAIKKT